MSPRDLTIVVIYLLVTFTLGILTKKYIGSISDYLVAGRGMGLYLGIASLISSEIGIITYMYFAQLGYLTGFASFVTGIIIFLMLIFLGTTGFVIKKLRELKLMTIPEYFEFRYSRGVRILGGVLMAVGGILNLGIFPLVEAKFLNVVLGLPEEYLTLTMASLLVGALIYTAAGGMVSLLVTNYVQYLFLSVGTLLVTFMALSEVGLTRIVSTVSTTYGTEGYDPFTNPTYGWTFIFWQLLVWMAVLTSWQSVAMRTFSTKDAQVGKKIFVGTAFLFLGRAVLPMFWGIAALAYLGSEVDSLDAMPIFLSRILPLGVMGLVIAGMLAASMSTYSSYLLAWSSIISQDVVAPVLGRELSEKSKILLNRVTIVLVTLFILFWSLVYKLPGPAYFYLNITANIFIGGTLACLVFGLYWRRASRLGAYLAFLLGAASAMGFFVLDVSADVAGFASFGLAFAGMILGSLLDPKPKAPLTESGEGSVSQ